MFTDKCSQIPLLSISPSFLNMGMEVLFCTIVLLSSLFFTLRYLKQKRKHELPPSPPALPILGHLHLLKRPLPRALQLVSDKYGPVVYLRLGGRPTIVVSSPTVAEECFTKNDIVFANRPQTMVSKHLNYKVKSIVFSPYGDHWRNLRRVATIHIFSSLSLQNSTPIRVDEIRHTVKKLLSQSSTENWKELNLTCLFQELVSNVIMRMVCGKRWTKSADVFRLVATPTNICDYIPILKWIGFGGIEKKLINLMRERDRLLQEVIDECRRNGGGSGSINRQSKTIVQALLSVQEAEPEYYTDDIVKGLIQLVFTAGTDTTNLTLQWAMSLLLNHPEILEKARDEIEKHIAPEHLIEESDLTKLPYLYCVINETLRLFPVAPLLVPHFSLEDCTVNGYKVPRGTTLLVNAWAIHRDPNVWEDPLEFKPERFEGIELGCEGFKFLPFGKGRRACPGNTLAMRFVGLVLGTLIQCFDWKRLGPEMVDLEETGGLTMHRVKPLKALYKPNLTMMNFISHL